MNNPSVKALSTGYVHVRFNQYCFAQFPVGHLGSLDDMIFDNGEPTQRAMVLRWWERWKEGKC